MGGWRDGKGGGDERGNAREYRQGWADIGEGGLFGNMGKFRVGVLAWKMGGHPEWMEGRRRHVIISNTLIDMGESEGEDKDVFIRIFEE